MPQYAPGRPGFTLLEALVVIVLMALLAGMVIDMIQPTEKRGRRASCGNNQRQIVLAMGVYANENDDIWPCRPTGVDGRLKAVSPDNLSTVIGTFEFVVVQTGNQMNAKVFACTSTPSNHPQTTGQPYAANQDLDETAGPKSVSNWVLGFAGTNVRLMPGYCYDWSVPTNADAARVVTADRGFDTQGHQSVTIVCFADNHVGNLKRTGGTPPKGRFTRTFLASDTPGSVYYNPDAFHGVPDNVYDADGDDGDAMAAGRGSVTRAWVR